MRASRFVINFDHLPALRRRGFLAAASVLMAATSLSGAIFKNGFVDHTVCCPAGGPVSADGTALRGSGSAPVLLAQVTTRGGMSGNAAVFSAQASAPAAAKTSPGGTTAAEIPVAPTTPPKEVDGHLQLEFARLSDFKITEPAFDPANKPEASVSAVEKQIPASIKQFDGKRVQLSGFMLPVKMEGLLVSQFLLMRDQMMCCYGVVPRMNDWVVVYAAKPVQFTPDVAVSFRGKLQVKAMQEQGFITGIYLLEEAAAVKL